MKPTRIGIVINPIAGRRGSRRGEAARREAFARREPERAGVVADVRMTRAQGDGRTLARECVAAGCQIVVAMGGDGTVNEVAQGLLGTDVPLGILPCGSGDGLARGLGVPRSWSRAFEVILSGRTSRMDVGYANDRLFLNVAGVGFDAAVGRVFATRRTRGAFGYVVNSVRLVWRYRAAHYDVECAGQQRSGRKFLIGFANAPEYGNGVVLAPDADIRDGLLDVLIADAGSPMRQIWRARRLFLNRRAPAEGLERLRTRTAQVTADRIVYHVDGEVFETTGTLDIRLVPLALAVRISPASPGMPPEAATPASAG
jgi:YegS/Rv2252/BmrU family lipid kinase